MDELQKEAMMVMLSSIDEKVDMVLSMVDRDMQPKGVFFIRLYLAHVRGVTAVMTADIIETREYFSEPLPF